MGDKVFVKMAPYKHIKRFDKKDKLALRFIRPFEVIECIGKVAY